MGYTTGNAVGPAGPAIRWGRVFMKLLVLDGNSIINRAFYGDVYKRQRHPGGISAAAGPPPGRERMAAGCRLERAGRNSRRSRGRRRQSPRRSRRFPANP